MGNASYSSLFFLVLSLTVFVLSLTLFTTSLVLEETLSETSYSLSNFPSSSNKKIHAAVNCFVTDPKAKIVLSVIGMFFLMLAHLSLQKNPG